MAKILLIEDDTSLRDIIKFNLSRTSNEVIDTGSANDALIYMEDVVFDIILLDLMLPGVKGDEFLRIIKSKTNYAEIPVIIISAKNSENKIVELLNLGADDYLTKPFSIKVLMTKINVLLRRFNKESANNIQYKNVIIDTESHKVTIDNSIINLTHTEFELLGFLMKHPEMVFTRSQLLSNIWGYESEIYTRTVDAHISSLRKKIKKAGFKIKAIPKVGYKIE